MTGETQACSEELVALPRRKVCTVEAKSRFHASDSLDTRSGMRSSGNPKPAGSRRARSRSRSAGCERLEPLVSSSKIVADVERLARWRSQTPRASTSPGRDAEAAVASRRPLVDVPRRLLIRGQCGCPVAAIVGRSHQSLLRGGWSNFGCR